MENTYNIPTFKKEDVNKILKKDELLVDSIEFKENKSVDILGKKVDSSSLVINIAIFTCTHLILFYFGMFKSIQENRTMLFLYVCLWSLFLYKTYYASVYRGNIQLELNNLITINQLIAVFIGSMIILMIALKYTGNNSGKNMKLTNYLFIVFMLIVLSFNLNLDQIDDAKVKNIRYFKETALDFIKLLLIIFIAQDFFIVSS